MTGLLLVWLAMSRLPPPCAFEFDGGYLPSPCRITLHVPVVGSDGHRWTKREVLIVRRSTGPKGKGQK